ncbi:MAG: flagellar export protein FliJ [Acidobacteria bacterium]|nr:flagellar export protein FliJ [Acidobacteriota bacterium]MBI3426995.1 flagellar export protein FliJ [Acidobacteriota bacterium]
MKRFRFRLQTVHNLRAQRRDEAERALLQASAAVSAAEAALEELQRQRATAESKMARATGQVYADELALQLGYLDFLAQRERALRERLTELEQQRETVRTSAIEAAREAEITSQLKQRQKERHEAEVASAEQNFLDEMAANIVRRGLEEENV